MKESLTITNFAGINHLEIELNKINILIGQQATGKSITAKLVFYFKSFTNVIRDGILNKGTKTEIQKKHLTQFINYFPKSTWPKDDFSIEYKVGNIWMKISKGKSLVFKYSKTLESTIRKAKKLLDEQEIKLTSEAKYDSKFIHDFYAVFDDLIKSDVSGLLVYNQIFVPAGRSFFSNIQSNIFSLLNSNQTLDPFLIEFGSFYESFKNSSFLTKKIDVLINNILNSKYLRERDKDFLLHKDKRKVNLSNASSGQQEILPLLIILSIFMEYPVPKGVTLYIEEPEAHLFPTAQKKIIQLIAKVFNSYNNNCQIIITTHSPYILSSFNNLMYAGSLSKKLEKNKLSKIQKIIKKEEIINPDLLSAFSLEKDGQLTSLIDTETKLIDQNVLDNVSDEISIEFGKLLDLEYEN